MRIISIKKLKDFWQSGYADSEQPLKCWYQIFKKEVFEDSHAIKRLFPSASIVGNNRVVFNISGNKYRLIVQVRYDLQIVFIRFVGTHSEYDKINAKEV
jgi:mRNA interferase HigB